jgi:hypothetical protein
MRPVLAVLACLAAAAVTGGCGGGDDGERAQQPPPVVQVDVESPADMSTVQAERVEVRGTVDPPGATVRVLGQRAESDGGSFSVEVPLEPGANVIDVIATARGRTPAFGAFRVTREMPVKVPDLDGLAVEEVQAQLQQLGLEAEVQERGGLLEDLLPGEPHVCGQDPEAGTEVRRGTRVRVEVGKGC